MAAVRKRNAARNSAKFTISESAIVHTLRTGPPSPVISPEPAEAATNTTPRHASSARPRSALAEEVAAVLERHRPDAVECALRRAGDAKPAQQRRHEPDRQGGGVAGERVDLDLIADHRKLTQHGVLDGPLRAGIALQHEPEDRRQHQQQRKQREERVIGDQRREAPRLVVAEFPQHCERNRQPAVALLVTIEAT